MARYVRSADIEAAPMLEETILYSPAAKHFCVLNSTAALVWERLIKPTTALALAAELRERFAVDRNVNVESDVQSALDQLLGLKLITQLADA